MDVGAVLESNVKKAQMQVSMTEDAESKLADFLPMTFTETILLLMLRSSGKNLDVDIGLFTP